jgi:hypothetical protein
MMTDYQTQERAFGASAVFRVSSAIPTMTIANQLSRRDRWVLLLLDGRRSIAGVARLTQRSELDVASTLVRFHQWGYIEQVDRGEYTTSQYETGYTSA